MQRIQQSVSRGVSKRFVVGESEDLPSIRNLEAKFKKQYEVDLKPDTKSKRRRSGIATAEFWAYNRPPGQNPMRFWWILTVSDGVGLVSDREKLVDIVNPLDTSGDAPKRYKRIELDGYELVHDGVGWSWQMTKATYSWWQSRIKRLCSLPPSRRKIGEPEDLIKDIARSPGFRLVRRQVGKLLGNLKGTWKRLRPEKDPLPELPTYLPYVKILASGPKRKNAKKKEAEKNIGLRFS